MKLSDKVVTKMNNLLMLNYEVEKMYLDAFDIVEDERLKVFFRERAFERNESARALRGQIIKLGFEPKSFDRLNKLSNRYYIIWKNIRPLLKEGNIPELLDQVCSVKQWSMDNYNSLLQEINLPLSLCKLLASQRDLLQSNMHTIKAREALVI
ncbi:DUF2383 domain-containing protein [Aestuariivivens insulae]|uniref:DUF2383 domain-containing protein n=1 Tax=Aestuariivivens insulae TaxID=1621988 RepID=UPI001F569B74|nr:DUF2383 domain-containing protein [Aestuariivivens insulae]